MLLRVIQISTSDAFFSDPKTDADFFNTIGQKQSANVSKSSGRFTWLVKKIHIFCANVPLFRNFACNTCIE